MARDPYSAGTSLAQVAAVFKPSARIPWEPGTINLDVGGGKYDLGTRYMADNYGVENLVYDPGNRSAAWNSEVLARLGRRGADTVTVSNVLNVVENPDTRAAILAFAAKHLRRGKVVVAHNG